MLFEKLVIENYGVYGQRTEFNLASTMEKPIILIGGFNGAGKTTIFETIMIALYGRSYFGKNTTKKHYTTFVANKIHRNGLKKSKNASVTLVFRFYHNGSDDQYTIKRGWDLDGMTVTESMYVKKNDVIMTDIDESQWQTFIEGLIPLGIARLFFFDGEKIVKITKWNDKNNEIQTALDTLLGTELIHRLYSDLELYMIRRSGKNDSKNMIKNEYNNIKREKEILVSELEGLVMELDSKNKELQDVTSKIAIKESQVASIGGGYTSIREELLTQKIVFEEKLRQQGKIIHEALGEDAPLYLVSSMLSKINKRIEKDMSITRQKAAASLLQENIESIKKDMKDKEFWPKGADYTKLYAIISDRLDKSLSIIKNKVFFDVSPNDASWMIQKISDMKDGHDKLLPFLDEYEKTQTRLDKTESELLRIPKDDEIGPHIYEINQMHEECGAIKSELSHMEQQISSKQAYKKILQNRLKKLIESIHKDKNTDAGLELASRMQKVLDTYAANLKEHKIKELESHLLDTSKFLLHKHLVDRVQIDRDTFEIKPYGKDDVQIPGGLLSMGERQIVGTALLWALAKTTGRSMPFVIDTPLGRLDGEHLANLVDGFYPFASHQIIILSTDREIGHAEYKKLDKYISNSYRILYDAEKSTTISSKGYFVEKKIART